MTAIIEQKPDIISSEVDWEALPLSSYTRSIEAGSERLLQSSAPEASSQVKVYIIIGDCRAILSQLTRLLHAFFQCVITSPPYFGLRDNGCGEQQIGLGKLSLYQAALLDVFSYLHPLLLDSGLFWCQVGDKIAGGGNGPAGKTAQIEKACASKAVAGKFELVPPGYKRRESINLPELCSKSARKAGFLNLGSVIWFKGNGKYLSSSRLDSCHETILQFSKSSKWELYRDALPEDLANCKGDVWPIRANRNEAANIYGVDHTSTFPPQLAGACAVLSAKPGQWILDPFGGLGNTAIGALRFGINTVLIEQKEAYAYASAAQLLDLADEFRPEVHVIKISN